MSIQENVQIVKDAFAAIGRGDMRGLQALSAEDIEWIVPGEDWPLAGTRRGHAGLADLLQTESETVESSFFEARIRSAGRPCSGRRLHSGENHSYE
jgi:uncharacterized protein